MKVQDKQAESIVGSGTPEDEWLDDTQAYRVRKTHLELLGLTSLQGKKILDAGCGPGTYGIMLAQYGNEVVGVEISPGSVQVANQRAKEKGEGHQSYRQQRGSGDNDSGGKSGRQFQGGKSRGTGSPYRHEHSLWRSSGLSKY